MLIIILILALSLPTQAEENGDISVNVDGEILQFENPPMIVNGRTFAPIRAVFEALGLEVGWNEEDRSIRGSAEGTEIWLQIDKTEALVNGQRVTLDEPAFISKGRTYVPVRFLGEATGAVIAWIENTRTVTITSNNSERLIKLLRSESMSLVEARAWGSEHGMTDDALALVINLVSDWYDYDDDGLLDYEEMYKYFTDPEMADSDGDGLIDGDLHERREYTYSILLNVEIIKPYNLNDMNALTQDTFLQSEGDVTSKFEIIYYPYAVAPVIENPDWRAAITPTLATYTESYLASAYTEEMQLKLIGILEDSGMDYLSMSDLDIATFGLYKIESEMGPTYLDDGGVARLLPYNLKTNTVDYDLLSTHKQGLECFVQRYDNDINFNRIYGNALSFEEKIELMAFGQKMFEENVIGNCTTTANYLTTIARALGIPTRIVVGFPMLTTDDELSNDYKTLITNEDIKKHLENIPGPTSDHFYPEFYIGNRWVNFDGADETGNIAVIRVMDYSLFDHYDAWYTIEKSETDWLVDNLMLQSLEESYPIHTSKYSNLNLCEDKLTKVNTGKYAFDNGAGDDFSALIERDYSYVKFNKFAIYSYLNEDVATYFRQGAIIYLSGNIPYNELIEPIRKSITEEVYLKIKGEYGFEVEGVEVIIIK